MGDRKMYNTSLSRVVKGSLGRTRLAFCITKDEDGDYGGWLSTLEISGRVIADGLEIQLALQSSASGAQTWRLESPEDVVADDKNGNEIQIRLQDVVLKAAANGQAMAMAVVGKQSENVVTTENWYLSTNCPPWTTGAYEFSSQVTASTTPTRQPVSGQRTLHLVAPKLDCP